jgi:hypothetical protein
VTEDVEMLSSNPNVEMLEERKNRVWLASVAEHCSQLTTINMAKS